MSNPTFRSGPISYKAEEDVTKFRLVQVGENGVKHAAAAGPVFGAVTENATAPKDEQPTNTLALGAPGIVAVHIGPATVPLEVDGDAAAIKQGTPIYAAADGKVSTSGSLLVGVAARNGDGKTVRTTLVTPVIAPASAG
ncbi:hypothetical protein [Corynebacterium kefirresidentii]|uniref:hypothetical protein n=1 Tax=Corynebacterium kefirresidentii TaxID=1979527 RepID=UPI000A3AFBC0|nr:hypothetical protein [Corynebacterium kefirresidentii]OUJ22336.1 hypothetical protein CBI45_09105 [Corynebacterium kefirresidentii]